MPVPTIEWKNNKVKIIDQVVLPGKLKFMHCRNVKEVWQIIKKMNMEILLMWVLLIFYKIL